MTYDQPKSLNELLAEVVAKTVLEQMDYCFRYTNKDPDDACLASGELIRVYLESLVESPNMQMAVKRIVGNKYNEEFFLDGFFNRE